LAGSDLDLYVVPEVAGAIGVFSDAVHDLAAVFLIQDYLADNGFATNPIQTTTDCGETTAQRPNSGAENEPDRARSAKRRDQIHSVSYQTSPTRPELISIQRQRTAACRSAGCVDIPCRQFHCKITHRHK